VKNPITFGWLLVVLLLVGCPSALAQRKSIDLMGEWRLLPVEGRELGAPVPTVDDTWQTYTAPGRPASAAARRSSPTEN